MTFSYRGALARLRQPNVQKRSLTVATLVGTVLNAINHGPSILRGDGVPWLPVLLTYAVPYCVATYGALSALRECDRHDGT